MLRTVSWPALYVSREMGFDKDMSKSGWGAGRMDGGEEKRKKENRTAGSEL